MGLGARGFVLTGGASLVRRLSQRFELGVEVTGAYTRDESLGKELLQVLIGGHRVVSDRATLDFAVLAGQGPGSARFGIQVGVSADVWDGRRRESQ